jgi:UDP-N-acetylmuramate dehydrogenase
MKLHRSRAGGNDTSTTVPNVAEFRSIDLGPYTTLGVGGPARELVEVHSQAELVDAIRSADASGDPILVLGGGSNVVISDDGFDGRVILIRNKGIGAKFDGDDVVVEVQAGENWDDVVHFCVGRNFAGVEFLSGIPGSTGATPVQNVGAYGEEVDQIIESVDVFDRTSDSVETFAPSDCGFSYRNSVFKRNDRYVILVVRFRLQRSTSSRPIRYAELARRLGVEVGTSVPLPLARETVLGLRRGKGMVIDPDDPDTNSVGSFFTNPILQSTEFVAFAERAKAEAGADADIPMWPAGEGATKVSAAWLIQQCGFDRGYEFGNARISTKHTLALTNPGGASSADVIGLASEIRERVNKVFGIELMTEPVFI